MTRPIPPVIYFHKIATRIEEMVVTGQMQQTSVSDAVQNVRIINSKKIEQMGAQNLTQLFKNELNIQLSTDPVLGTGMSLQGISGENVKLLIDGVPVIGRLNGTVDLDQINIQNIEKIEIIEGPLSVNYGSDALAGTINIITKKNTSQLLSGTAESIIFNANINNIGYSWKSYQFDVNKYVVDFEKIFIIKDQEGFYYKLRFIDFYDQGGNKGTPTFEFQRL